MFFQGWTGLLRVTVVGLLGYVALVLFLRFAGKRTLSKMNAFDLVVTVALGSTLATLLLSNQVALAEGILAFALLISFQFVVTWSSIRSSAVRRLVKAEPRLLFYKGVFIWGAMAAERVTEDEIRAAIRKSGAGSLEQVDAVVLETDATFSVVRTAIDGTVLQDIRTEGVVL